MLYLGRVASLCKQVGPVITCLCPKYIKFSFQNYGTDREDKKQGYIVYF